MVASPLLHFRRCIHVGAIPDIAFHCISRTNYDRSCRVSMSHPPFLFRFPCSISCLTSLTSIFHPYFCKLIPVFFSMSKSYSPPFLRYFLFNPVPGFLFSSQTLTFWKTFFIVYITSIPVLMCTFPMGPLGHRRVPIFT